MDYTIEIVATQADALTRRAVWEAQGTNYIVTVSQVGVFTAFDYRTTPNPTPLINPPQQNAWLVQVTMR